MSSATDVRPFDRWWDDLRDVLDRRGRIVDRVHGSPMIEEVGRVLRVDGGIAEVTGLPGVGSEELVRLSGDRLGMAYDLNRDERLGVILLDQMAGISAGDEVRRTGEVMSVPVGEGLLGRIIDPTGRPIDGRGPIVADDRWPIERPAPAIMDRAPVDTPLQTGIKAIDALTPIGRGQRELILGDRETGKTAIAVDTVLNQRDTGVVSVYCAIGLRSSAVAKVVADLRDHGALESSIIVVATGDDPPGRQFVAPYAATTIAEYFRDRGDDSLVVYDDLTRHARAYRELSLLLRRPPGREAFPGDIFYIHSRLLERPTHLRHGGGSLTALPIIETQAQNISAYIPTNLISITDGQVYLSPKLFRQGILPAVDIGRSVSRVGGRAQLPAYRAVTGDLRLSYSQFEELERFSRYGARLEQRRMRQLERGRRVRQVLKQPRYRPMPVAEQIAVLAAVTGGVFDEVDLDEVELLAEAMAVEVLGRAGHLFESVRRGAPLGADQLEELRETSRSVIERLSS